MNWFSILKMPKGVKYNGPDFKNEAQYKAASIKIRLGWHDNKARTYNLRLKTLQKNSDIDLTDVENPIYQELKYYQEMRNFHARQSDRIRKCLKLDKTECNDFYSLELEGDNRRKNKLITTPTGKQDPYVELSLEAYNDLTVRQKKNYHDAMAFYGKDYAFHGRMKSRLQRESRLQTFPSPKYGGESIDSGKKETTKEEYLNMEREDKKRFHTREKSRARRAGNKELNRFHNKMRTRIMNNDLPTYFSPEHEQEES
tara:strand:+ start:41 stop:808 length:768 start_codon:yes stop_codon:yes gene_type:complete